MKKLIVLVVMFPLLAFSQTFKEVISSHPRSGKPKEVIFKDEDLRKIKYIKYYEDGSVAKLYNYDPFTQKKDGNFTENIYAGNNIAFTNSGRYNQGVLNCEKYHYVGEYSVVVGKIQDGYPKGLHKVYYLIEETKTTYIKAYSYGQPLFFDQNFGTGVFELKFSHNLLFNENGVLDCQFEAGPMKLKFDNGRLHSYIFNQDRITNDSISYNSKIIKRNGKFLKRENRALFFEYDYFDNPFEVFIDEENYTPDKAILEHFSSKPKNILSFDDFVKGGHLDIDFHSTSYLNESEINYSKYFYIDFNEPSLVLNNRGIYVQDYYSIQNSLSNDNLENFKIDDALLSELIFKVLRGYFVSIYRGYKNRAPSSSASFPNSFSWSSNNDVIHKFLLSIGCELTGYDGPGIYSYNMFEEGLIKILNLIDTPIDDFYLLSKTNKDYAVSYKSLLKEIKGDIEKVKREAERKALEKRNQEKVKFQNRFNELIEYVNNIKGLDYQDSPEKKKQFNSQLESYLDNKSDLILISCVVSPKKVSNPFFSYTKYDLKKIVTARSEEYQNIVYFLLSRDGFTYFLPTVTKEIYSEILRRGTDAIEAMRWGICINKNGSQ